MALAGFTAAQWLVLVQHELFVFAGTFFLIGAIDEMAVDLIWIWLRVSGRAPDLRLNDRDGQVETLTDRTVVFIPAWREASIIGPTIRNLLMSWPHSNLRVYIGCYRNDPATLEVASKACEGDRRVRLVVHDVDGPTTKADCLNRLYRALALDEYRQGIEARMIVLHDAEDMVDPAALGVLDRAIGEAEMVQLPVLPEPQPSSRWIGSHYCEEFAEAHGKGLVVRNALGAGLPLAGVGCAIRRDALSRLASQRGGDGPFAAECLTEDYELGLGVSAAGGVTRFIRCHAADGRLIATRACFPARLDQAVRQKTRWLHGIAFQGWDRLGWSRNIADSWMRLRDRRGPFIALVLAAAYLLLVLATVGWVAGMFGIGPVVTVSPLLKTILYLNFASLAWRAIFRFGFTAREYGWREGARSILRLPVANIISIMAGRRAIVAYAQSLRGQRVRWDKTHHDAHPKALRQRLSKAAG